MHAPPDIRPSDYSAILKLWTREEDAYKGFEHKITTKATLITPMLRAAFQKRFPEVYGYGGQVTRHELREVHDDDGINFFVGIYVPNFRWNDLDKPESIWHVSLQRINVRGEVEASVDARKIEKVKKDENLATIFPYLVSFDQIYVMRFPSVVGPSSLPLIGMTQTVLRMRIASSFSTGELSWIIEP